MTSITTDFRIGFFMPTQDQKGEQDLDAEARQTFGIPDCMAVRPEMKDGCIYVWVNKAEWQKKQRRDIILNRVRVAGVICVMSLITVITVFVLSITQQ